MPTFVDIAGGPKGDDLKKQIEAGKYPGIVKTTLDGVNQRAYLEGKGDSARDTLFYYSGTHPSAVRYKNWKFYYAMAPSNATGGLMGVQSLSLDEVDNIKRDPFETAVGASQADLAGHGRRAGRAEHGLYLRLEPAAHRADVVDEGADDLQGVPGAADSVELQPGSDHYGNAGVQGRQPRWRITRVQLQITGACGARNLSVRKQYRGMYTSSHQQ